MVRSVKTFFLTDDGGVVEQHHDNGYHIVSAAATNTSSEIRMVFGEEKPSEDHWATMSVCHSGFPFQEGLALRVREDNGVVRAITVTKNIWGYATWVYNVHLWDTGKYDPKLPAELIAQFDMSHLNLQGVRRLAVRAKGNKIDFKVWDQEKPSWREADHVRSVVVPDEYVYEGSPMIYAGHIPPGGWGWYGGYKHGTKDVRQTQLAPVPRREGKTFLETERTAGIRKGLV